MAGVDHDLLLAILALQAGLCSQDTLRDALRESGSTGGSVHTVLRDRQTLAEHELTLLEGLVDLHLRLHGNNLQQSLASFPAGVDVSQLIPSTRTDLTATLNTLGAAPTTTETPS